MTKKLNINQPEVGGGGGGKPKSLITSGSGCSVEVSDTLGKVEKYGTYNVVMAHIINALFKTGLLPIIFFSMLLCFFLAYILPTYQASFFNIASGCIGALIFSFKKKS